MANGHGGYREGSGRKSKAEEMGLPQLIEDVVGEEGKKRVLKTLYDMAIGGDVKAITLLMAYAFGKPKETKDIDLTTDGETLQITGITVT